ncbi:hypothetical protein Cgig2_027939 [Carnegiea gigantea]|uniref:Uncharacterized protein n=1 Tax=Carnegiea gigantea TaxID=171969 RepID=A0A9Q1GZ85_9CARY|nr:hypothetical protein Cgig2_027939 [Carnegiea gigantea]
MKEGIYDDELLKFLLTLEPENFQASTTVKTKFAELFRKEKEKQARLRMAQILPPKGQIHRAREREEALVREKDHLIIGAFGHGETQETKFYSLVEVDIWPVLTTAEFHGTSDIDVLRTGNPEPLLVSLSKLSSISLHQSWANRPSLSRLVLNILESPHDASTTFNSIVLVPLMFSTLHAQ